MPSNATKVASTELPDRGPRRDAADQTGLGVEVEPDRQFLTRAGTRASARRLRRPPAGRRTPGPPPPADVGIPPRVGRWLVTKRLKARRVMAAPSDASTTTREEEPAASRGAVPDIAPVVGWTVTHSGAPRTRISTSRGPSASLTRGVMSNSSPVSTTAGGSTCSITGALLARTTTAKYSLRLNAPSETRRYTSHRCPMASAGTTPLTSPVAGSTSSHSGEPGGREGEVLGGPSSSTTGRIMISVTGRDELVGDWLDGRALVRSVGRSHGRQDQSQPDDDRQDETTEESSTRFPHENVDCPRPHGRNTHS